ncbi:MAG: DUF4231 domain-containing protein [Paracoccaceae bacterium]
MAAGRYIPERLERAIAAHDARARRAAAWSVSGQSTLLVSAILTPALLGAGEFWVIDLRPGVLRLAALGTATVAAVAAGLTIAAGWRDRWVANRTLANALTQERVLYETRAGAYAGLGDGDALAVLVERCEALLAEDVTGWSVGNGRALAKGRAP